MFKNALMEESEEKAYARNQVAKVMTFDEFVKHIASHNGVFSRGTVKGVVSDTCTCLVELLLNGNKVKFGELGTFSISLQSEPADSMAEFSAKNIKEVNILFTPGEDFQNLRSKAEFNQVTSRAVQAASLKAIKEGENIVDLTALKKGNATDDPTDVPDNEEPENSPTPGGGGNTSGGGTDDNGELAG